MLLKILQISECLKACNFINKKLQHCEIFKSACSEEHLRTSASVYLKSKLQIKQFTHKPKTFNFRIYKVFSYLFSFANFSSTKFIFTFESFSLKMHMCLQKHIIFVCLYVFLSCMLCFHVCTHECFHLISNVHIVRTFENRIPFQTFEKWHNVSYRYVSYIKSETSFIWRRGTWLLKSFQERVEENHIYHIVKPSSTVKTGTVYRGCNVCYQFFWKIEKLT